ncbi:uncharacterized protein PAC_06400 [Phialocephala subalpina]|uniref:Rhodopsin domain-containing protein n=1 Tax=Phialocephala subalpina TaxID=576137 RepID=A0A1L7WUR7_9HELO|nr:uncharacterized protein PAC_06400 [Phialocephala subalpina]
MAAENRGPELAAVVISLLVFCLVTVGLRCYTMGYMLKRFYAEDWLAVATLVFYTAYSVFALVAVHFGLGQHVANVPTEDHPHALLFKWLGQVFYVLVAVLVKFIVGLFLLRICSHQRWQRITIYTLLGVLALFNAFYIFIVILQCTPVEFYWFRYQVNSPVHGTCNKTKLAIIPTYISLLLNVVSDFTLALLPVSFVWKSKMEIRTKVSVVGVLALGSIASLATAARIPYAKQLLSNPDYLYNFTDLAIWSTVEIGLGLSASSLATLKPLFRKLKILASTQRSRSASNVKQGTQRSTLHSRMISTLSIRLGSNAKSFREIEEENASMGSKPDTWPFTPGEKFEDVELAAFGNKTEIVKNESMVSRHDDTGEIVNRVRQFSFSNPRPPPPIHPSSPHSPRSPLSYHAVR